MKLTQQLPVMAIFTLALASCGGGNKGNQSGRLLSDVLENSPIVAEKVVIGNDTVVVGKLASEIAPVTLLASEMFDEFELVKLEDSDEALTGGGNIWVSEGHILIWDDNNIKLYDRKGKYIANIGARGQGPGEYIAPYFLTVDEKNGKIYMMTYSAKNINTYSLNDGSFIGSIPLAFESPKGFCTVDAEKGEITVASIQFKEMGATSPVWVQDFEGNVISAVQRPDLQLNIDFSNEILPAITNDGKELYHSQCLITSLSQDTVYRSDGKGMHPEFTYDFGKDVPMHSLHALPQFYSISIYGDPTMVTDNSWIVKPSAPYIIDRSTLKGAPAELMIDQLGTLMADNYWNQMHSPGYFTQSVDPGDLLDMLQASPDSHPLANEEGLKKMEELRNSIDPEGNHYVMIGHWRK